MSPVNTTTSYASSRHAVVTNTTVHHHQAAHAVYQASSLIATSPPPPKPSARIVRSREQPTPLAHPKRNLSPSTPTIIRYRLNAQLAVELAPHNTANLPSLSNMYVGFSRACWYTSLVSGSRLAYFYYLKNIAGRRLVGLRWWNEVDPQTGESKWVFESSEPGTKVVNATDSRFFWLSLYVQPLLWILLAVLAIVRLQFLWLPLVIIALVLTIMNTLAFSRCDKFSQASNLAGSALGTTNLAGSIATNLAGRWFSRN
ncbi:hypothetical protein MHUMG1_06805 [Metarhizium humberi]|uniref:Golgi apparatus membrane protein TVP23 n=1 Tax=Metarhizium humberi TaxID=2596975 RepID=A0A9P8M899_9HYPO|nr:hypothetical protein MHUMG1_06805 [Metarhizium humberi]